jgi:hypothetical protein
MKIGGFLSIMESEFETRFIPLHWSVRIITQGIVKLLKIETYVYYHYWYLEGTGSQNARYIHIL